MTATLELIAEQLWNAGYYADIRYRGEDEQPWIAVVWKRVPSDGNEFFVGRGNSALVALERARAELEKTK